VQRYFRLFMQPGVGHVFGGPGPSTWSPIDEIRDWVQGGIAPATMTATLTAPTAHGTRTVETRPWCPYPDVVTYRGHGNQRDAASFRCAPDHDQLAADLAAERHNVAQTFAIGDLANLPN
jgi:feruloyl esterase